MNNWQNEDMAEYHRQQLMEAAEHIFLEKLALEAGGSCPTLVERILLTFASWMSSKGKQLRKRYEATTVNFGNAPRVASQLNG